MSTVKPVWGSHSLHMEIINWPLYVYVIYVQNALETSEVTFVAGLTDNAIFPFIGSQS